MLLVGRAFIWSQLYVQKNEQSLAQRRYLVNISGLTDNNKRLRMVKEALTKKLTFKLKP